jgi:hypothetical protein
MNVLPGVHPPNIVYIALLTLIGLHLVFYPKTLPTKVVQRGTWGFPLLTTLPISTTRKL